MPYSGHSFQRKSETNFDSSFSVSSEEYDPFEKTDENEEQLQNGALRNKT